MEKEYTLLHKNAIKNELINLTQLTFEVTDTCNLKCKYCGYGEFYGYYDERNNRKLPVEIAITLLEYLNNLWSSKYSRSYKKNTYISFYGGEPLLNMYFIKKIVSWIKKQNNPYCNFIFTMTTNAVLLDKCIDYLVLHDFHVLVSLDGNEYNHSYRVDKNGNNSYSRIYENLNYVKNKYPDYFKKNISFNAVLHNRNNYTDLIDYFQTEFEKTPRVSELNLMGIDPEKSDAFFELYKNKEENIKKSDYSKKITETIFMDDPEISRLAAFLHWHSGNVFQSYKDLFSNEQLKKWIPTGTCLPFGRKMFLTVNGKILSCERIPHRYSLGKVTKKEVILDMDEIVRKYNEWYNKYIPQCSKCFNNHTCQHCMFNNKNLDKSGKCDNYMNKDSFLNYKNYMHNYLSAHPHLYKKIMEEVVIH